LTCFAKSVFATSLPDVSGALWARGKRQFVISVTEALLP
jgi:hypothetical protein